MTHLWTKQQPDGRYAAVGTFDTPGGPRLLTVRCKTREQAEGVWRLRAAEFEGGAAKECWADHPPIMARAAAGEMMVRAAAGERSAP